MIAIALCGCYSFTATTLPSHIKTVRIAEIDNKTLDPVMKFKQGFKNFLGKMPEKFV